MTFSRQSGCTSAATCPSLLTIMTIFCSAANDAITFFTRGSEARTTRSISLSSFARSCTGTSSGVLGEIIQCMTRDRRADLHGGGHVAAMIGDRARGLGRKPHPVDRHLVGVGVAGAILGADAHADAVADALAGVIHHRFFEPEPLGAAILEVEIGVVGLAFERAAEDAFERAVVHAESVEEKFIGSNEFVGHCICRL